MKFYIVLLFISFNVINSEDLVEIYSIDEFLDEIINNGIYNLLREVKLSFGTSVAIETCFQIYNTNNCEKAILSFISVVQHAPSLYDITKNFTEEEKIKNFEKMISLFSDYNGPTNMKRKLNSIIYKLANAFEEIFSTDTNKINTLKLLLKNKFNN